MYRHVDAEDVVVRRKERNPSVCNKRDHNTWCLALSDLIYIGVYQSLCRCPEWQHGCREVLRAASRILLDSFVDFISVDI